MDAVHPRYRDLKDNIRNSEVLASQYAAETLKISDTVDKEEMEQAMKDWDSMFLKEGLTVNNSNIGVFSEVSLLCEETGNKELAGKFAIAIVNSLHQVARQYMTSHDLLERLEGISDRLYTGVDRMEKQTDALSKIIPKKKVIIAKKRAQNGQPSDNDNINQDRKEGGQLKPGSYVILADNGGNTIVANQGENPISDAERAMEVDTGDTGNDDKDVPDDSKSTLNPMSETAKAARDGYRAYYSDPRFSNLAPEKQISIIEYYITQILGLSSEAWTDDAAKYHMLVDLIDKGRVIDICEAAKTGELTPSLIVDSVEEIVHAINTCHEAYGNYGAIVLKTGGVHKLSIT